MNLPIASYASVWIVGCGDIGRRLARLWQQESVKVLGMVSSMRSANEIEKAGIQAICADLDETDLELPQIDNPALLYYFIPPPSSGVYDTRCQNMLQLLSQQPVLPKRIIAISTTGVYGDCGGSLVNEDQAPKPNADRAKRRLHMETLLKQWCEQNRVALVILRVGGIYGPERFPVKRIKQGIPVLKEELAPKTNRIHEDDLANICFVASSCPYDFRIYNVSDGTNSNMTEYFYTLADHFGLKRPPAVDWDEAEKSISKGMLSYLRESRRVDNSRMLSELEIKLRYPDLQTALQEMNIETV